MEYKANSRRTRRPLTPRSSLNLKLQHRNKERIRHQTINEMIFELCRLIPGDFKGETKVLRLQRVMRYCYYLNSTIENLCNELKIIFKDDPKLNYLQILKNSYSKQLQRNTNCKKVNKPILITLGDFSNTSLKYKNSTLVSNKKNDEKIFNDEEISGNKDINQEQYFITNINVEKEESNSSSDTIIEVKISNFQKTQRLKTPSKKKKKDYKINCKNIYPLKDISNFMKH